MISLTNIVPGFLKFGADDDKDKQWQSLEEAIRIYLDVINDPITAVKSEYLLWLKTILFN